MKLAVKEVFLDTITGLSGFGIVGFAVVDYVQRIFYEPSLDQYKVLFSVAAISASITALTLTSRSSYELFSPLLPLLVLFYSWVRSPLLMLI